MIVGFGAKAGMMPMQSWLPAAHPVAPAPASAVLSGVITKGGVVAVIRVTYYMFGPEFLAGSWPQYVLLTLTLATVFVGSMLAYREKQLKRRLAYSTVSQVSYVLFGLMLLTPDASRPLFCRWSSMPWPGSLFLRRAPSSSPPTAPGWINCGGIGRADARVTCGASPLRASP